MIIVYEFNLRLQTTVVWSKRKQKYWSCEFPERFLMFGIAKYLLIGITLKIFLCLSKDAEGHKNLKTWIIFCKNNFCNYGQFLIIFSLWEIQKGFWVSVSKPSIKLVPKEYMVLRHFSFCFMVHLCRHFHKALLVRSYMCT